MSTGTEVAVFSASELLVYAKNVAASRLFPGVGSEQAAFTLLALCHSEGLHPMQALKRYHLIEGRPSMRADAMQAEFQRHGGIVRWLKTTEDECTAAFIHPTHAPGEGLSITVRLKELIDSGVATAWDKDASTFKVKKVYKQFPAQMLRARVISQGVRAVLPGVVAGIYTPEEVQDFEERLPVRHHATPRRSSSSSAPAPTPCQDDDQVINVSPVEPAASGDVEHWESLLARSIRESNRAFFEESRLWNATAKEVDFMNYWHCINGLGKRLVKAGVLAPGDPLRADGSGKWDHERCADAVQRAYEADPARIAGALSDYLAEKLLAAMVAAGFRDAPDAPDLPGMSAAEAIAASEGGRSG